MGLFSKWKQLKIENAKLKEFKSNVAHILFIYDSFEIDDCVNIAHEIEELFREDTK